METCVHCNKEFKNKYSLSNYLRYFKKHGNCESPVKYCLNPTENKKCQITYTYSVNNLCRSCAGKKFFKDIKSGRTYEDMYGLEKSIEMRSNQSESIRKWNTENPGYFAGENNPNFGKKNKWKGLSWEQIYGEEKAKEMKISQSIRSKEFSLSENGKIALEKMLLARRKDENRIGVYSHWVRKYGKEVADCKMLEYSSKLSSSLKGLNVGKTGAHSSTIKSMLKKLNLTYDEYISLQSEYDRYRNVVNQITRQQPIEILENHEYRGVSGIDGNYHLDHIYPIRQGFLNKINPEIIGHISNLRFIPWKDNIIKDDKLTDESWDIFLYMVEEMMS